MKHSSELLAKYLRVILKNAENICMNEEWYGDRFKGTFLTDKVIPTLFARIPLALLILGIITWLKYR